MSDTCDVRINLEAMRIDSRPKYASVTTDAKKPIRVMAADVTRGGVTLRLLVDETSVMQLNIRSYPTGGHALAEQITAALSRAMNPANNRLEEASL